MELDVHHFSQEKVLYHRTVDVRYGASTIVSIERHLSHAESVKRSKDKQYKDLAPASRGNRRRTPTSCARSPTAGRRLTPLKSVKGGPSIRPQNGPVQLHMGFRKSTSDLTKSEAVVPPVTNLGLELADNLHENRGNRLPTSRVISSKTTQQAHRSDQYAITNIADVSNLVDEFYLRGRSSSKASTFTLSDDYDDQVPPPMPISPQRLTPIRTPSASEKNRGLRIPNTINEGEMGGASEYVVNPGRQGDYNTHFSNGNLASVQSKNTMYVFPNQPKVLACSPICSPPEGADIKLVDCSQDFINKTDSPRSASNLGKEGSFNIKETRIRGSDDSGIPEDKNSSKSSSVSSSVSNLSSSSAGLPDLDDRETSGDHGSSTSQQGKDSKEAVNIKKSESDSILGRPAPEGKGTCKNVDSVKLKQIAKDNAKITQQKSVVKDNDTSRSTALRKGVTTGSKQEAVGKNSSKLVVPASAKTNAKVSSGTQETNQNTNRGMESVQVHKSFQQGTKSSASPNVNLQETTKANNQPRSRPWNSSTNLKSINTRLGSTSNNTNKPPVPARPSAQAVSRQGMAPAKSQLAAVSQTPKVIVEELEQEEVSPDQDKPEGTSSEASDPIQGPANRMNTVSDSNATKLKPINSGVAGPGTMENNSSKSNHASNSMPRGITDDRTTAKLKPSNTAVNKQANSVPAATSGRQNNVSRVQAKPGTAPKPSQTRQTSKPNVPKNSVANPERPPRKSQSTSSVSVDDGHLAKQPHTTQRCDRKDEDKGSAVISDNQTDEPGAASEGSKPSTEPETTSSSSTAVKVCKGGMTVEEVDVPLPLSGVNEGKEKSSATGQNSTKTTGHSVAQSNSELLKSSGSDESTSSSGLPPVVNTNIVPNEKSSAPSIKQIQVKPYQEETAPSQHEGPVIVDIFESLRRERELAEQQQREEAATKQKQLSHPKKVKTPDARVMSASSRTKRSIKSATSEKNAERSKRQQAKKTKKRSKKKSEKEELMLSERMEKKQKRVNNSRKLSGEDWYRHSEDGNNKGSGDRQENDELDDSDDETTWVQPNYIGKDSDYDEDDDILTTSIQRNDESLRRSWERKTKCIPGQIHGDDSDDDLPEDVFEDTEDVQLNVVFTIGSLSDESPGTTTRDIIDITHETKASESLFKPSGKVNLRRVDVKGTSDTVKQPGGILPQVSEAIAAFSRQVTGIELDEMLEGEAYRDSPAHLESDQVKDTASCDSCAKASGSQYKDSGGQSDVGHLDKNHNNKTDNTGFTDVQKEKNNKGSDVLKTETLVQNTVIRHSEGFKAPKVKPVKVERNQSEDEEIREMINEILKSTPDPSLTLSWKSRSERSCTSEGSRTSVQRSSLQRSLADSQNCSFKEIPNVADKESSSFHPLPTEDEENEIKTLQKLVDTCKNMPLQVDIIQGQGQALNNEAVPKGKPPVPPKSLTSGKPAVMQSMKSPRFVRKHDSVKGRQHKVTLLGDTDTSETGSDFDTVSLPMDDQDTLVPSDRAETVTSHLGRHNSGSRATSSMTNRSDDVETIQWKRGNLLGKGAFGKVWCGLTNAGELIAVKQIELNIDNMEKAEREYEKIQEEVELLKTLKHQNIVGYLGTSLEDNVVSIFMQFVPGGSIFNLISRFGALEEEVFCRYTQQILQGVEYLHSNNVIHRDIKGGNIMLMQNGVIKLIDFGCAKRLYLNVTPSLNSRNKEQLLKSMRGTPYWMAPEVVREEGHGTKSDIWSIGCTVFEMATMKPPWANEPPYAAIFAIGNNDKPVPSLPQKFSQEARLFVSACLTRDQNKRPSATQLLSHAFILKRKKKPGSFS